MKKISKAAHTLLLEGRHNASMSKTALLLNCQYWASPLIKLRRDKRIPDIPRFGLAVHETMEVTFAPPDQARSFCTGELPEEDFLGKEFRRIAEEWEVDYDRMIDYNARLTNWITNFIADNGYETAVYLIEKKVAYNPFSGQARFLKSKKQRDYSESFPTELPGTNDFALIPEDPDQPLVLLDYKTGSGEYDAGTDGQLKSLACALTVLTGRKSVRAFILRIDDDFIEPYEALLKESTLKRHRKSLRIAMRKVLDPCPSLRMGSHCTYCPALDGCPAHRDPMRLADLFEDALSDVEEGFVFSQIPPAEQLLKKMRDKLRYRVQMNGPKPLDNGKWLTVRERKEENISKSSIRRNLGDLAGEELIDQLRAKGVFEESKHDELYQAVDPSGKK